MNKVGFIGAGNMGFAIMKGIKNSKMDVDIFAYDVSEASLEKASSLEVNITKSENEVVSSCKYVILAVKPQSFTEVLEKIKHDITEDTVIISIAAGISGEFLKSNVSNEKLKSVLVMPNTPLLLGEGATAMSKVEPTTDDEFDFVCSIFKSCGKIAVLPNEKMREIIAINGSSPAFTYLFAKGFIDYAEKNEIDSEAAKVLFAQTLIGSAKMILDSGYSIEQLIDMVSSKGGTTIAGLNEFYSGNFLELIDKACNSCTKRAYELSK